MLPRWFFCFVLISRKEWFIFIHLFIFKIYFIYFWLCWVSVALCRLSLVAANGGFSLWSTGLGVRASVVVACGLSSCGSWALGCRLSSGTRAQLLRDMWDLPGPGLEPMSPALAGGFLTTAPPGKPLGGFDGWSHRTSQPLRVAHYLLRKLHSITENTSFSHFCR